MTSRDFADYVRGKTLDQIVHEARRESADRLLSEALVPLALLLSRELLNVLLINPRDLESLPTPTTEETAA